MSEGWQRKDEQRKGLREAFEQEDGVASIQLVNCFVCQYLLILGRGFKALHRPGHIPNF
jgi:hypothetical protein